ncbi:hypothetical protein CBR_g5613 [Chara braunii]|uniref:Uncharacterized protein n=1 Tax=Chara braunii TaxID=69332 RepID=A0A388JRN4_CHABU|nr:hypothetical protein CBR_g5613 [Chara braunii]|eukprot:GBG60437.1 hypothetical protein CBR_g5613 [Chara braunii]
MVTDDVLGEAVMACDMIEEEGGDVFGTVRSRARNEVGTFGQAADNDVDAIMSAVGLGEAAHEVHGDGLPPVRAADCEGMNHDKEFLLVGGVIHLHGKELLACEGDGVFAEWSLGVSGRVLDGGSLGGVTGEMLGQYDSNGEVGGVSGDIEMARGVGDLEDRGCGDGLLDGDNVAEVFDARSSKRTFVELLEGGAKDEDVIKVHDDADFEEVTGDAIHGGLECGGGIGESERHYEELIVPEPRAEWGLMGVLLADTDLVEATTKVNLGEIFGSTNSIKELRDPRQGLREDVFELVEDRGGGGVIGGGLIEFVRWEQVLWTFTVKDKAIVGGVGVHAGHMEELMRGDEALEGWIWEIGNVDGCVGGVGEEEEVGVVRGGELVRGGGGGGVLGGDVVEEARAGRGRWFGVLGEGGGGATMVKVVVDEGGGVQVDGVGVEVEAEACPEAGGGWGGGEGGVVVVTAVMAGEFVATRSDSWAMLLTELERRSDMLMEDWAMVGEEGLDDVAGAEVEVVAAGVIAATVAAVAAAAATAATAHWEVLVWRGGMWRWGGQFLFTRIERRQVI